MSRRLTPVIIIVVLLGAQGLSGQELSTSVYPSEDELRQALELGEIDYAQYQQLVEFVLFGVLPRERHLLDAIPNLSALLIEPEALVTDLEQQQSSAFAGDSERQRYGRYRQSWSEELEAHGRARYRTSLVLFPGPAWQTELRLAREYSGRERVVYRAVRYRSAKSPLRTLNLGNYTARFGLGTVFGYRGKILRYSPSLESESFLFPDYGGANGLFAQTRTGGVDAQWALSNQRDEQHQLVSMAAQWSLQSYKRAPSLIVGLSTIRNRATDATVRDYQVALYEDLRFGRNWIRVEIAGQGGSARSVAGVGQGRYRMDETDLSYSLWAYGDRWLTVTSGAKSGNLSRTVHLEAVALEFSDRRAGQEGGHVRLVNRFSTNWEFVSAATFAGFDRNSYRLEWLPGLIYRVHSTSSLRADYQTTVRHRTQGTGTITDQKSRGRLELRIKSDNWQVRSYIASSKPLSGDTYVSWLLQVSLQSADIGKVDGWVTLDRIQNDGIGYWYGYIRHRCLLFSELELGFKLAHRFNRTAGDRHYTAITFDLTAAF